MKKKKRFPFDQFFFINNRFQFLISGSIASRRRLLQRIGRKRRAKRRIEKWKWKKNTQIKRKQNQNSFSSFIWKEEKNKKMKNNNNHNNRNQFRSIPFEIEIEIHFGNHTMWTNSTFDVYQCIWIIIIKANDHHGPALNILNLKIDLFDFRSNIFGSK